MAPKKKSDVGDVDGVPYILNIASRVVVVGTGLVRLGAGPAAPPSTPGMPMPPSTPSTENPPTVRLRQSRAAAPTSLPMVVMVKFNGKVIVERSTVQLPPSATWEQVARLRLGDLAEQYMDTTLKVALYPTGVPKKRAK